MHYIHHSFITHVDDSCNDPKVFFKLDIGNDLGIDYRRYEFGSKVKVSVAKTYKAIQWPA